MVIRMGANRDDAIYNKRVSLFLDAYGWEQVEVDLFDMLQRRIEALCLLMKRKAAEGDIAFQKMIDEGHYDHYQEELRFIRTHGQKWF